VAAGALLAVTGGDEVAGALAIGLVVPALVLLVLDVLRTERRRHELAEEELAREAATLESLVESLGTIAATLEPDEIPELARREAERLFDARAELRSADAATEPVDGEVLVPLHMREAGVDLLRIVPRRPLGRADSARALVLADFATRLYENARLRVEAESREVERARLSQQLVTAEQEERRRLAFYLHDTSVQALAGIALMLDAARQSLAEGREEGAAVFDAALQRLREAIRGLRDLSFALEPVVLSDQGFAPAVNALVERIADARIEFDVDVGGAEALSDDAQAALYQIVREAVDGAVRRGPPTRVSVKVRREADGTFEAVIADDAPGERRRRSFDPIVERARAVSGNVDVEHGDGSGTTVRVRLPAYAART
jgi:signal transduction histidine kinase